MKRKAPTSIRRQKPKGGTAGPRTYGRLQRVIDRAVKTEIEVALREAEGNMAATARALGVSYQGLWSRMRSLGINPERFRR
jgi:DNA-binding NtrC family response regulator